MKTKGCADYPSLLLPEPILMSTQSLLISLLLLFAISSAEPSAGSLSSYLDPEDGKTYYATETIEIDELELPKSLPAWRRTLISAALALRTQHGWQRYHFGGSDPNRDQGFDCSGAIYFLYQTLGLKIPRTSSDQYLALKEAGTTHQVSPDAEGLDHHSFAALTPGDLVFWSGTYRPTDGRKTKITHVGIYLGRTKSDQLPLMACASKGRYYRGKRRDGYGLYDFKLPKKTSRSKLVAYGNLNRAQD